MLSFSYSSMTRKWPVVSSVGTLSKGHDSCAPSSSSPGETLGGVILCSGTACQAPSACSPRKLGSFAISWCIGCAEARFSYCSRALVGQRILHFWKTETSVWHMSLMVQRLVLQQPLKVRWLSLYDFATNLSRIDGTF